MAQTAVAGVVAAGRVPTWIIPQASIATDPSPGTYSIPLTALTGGTTVKADCHMDAGDLSVCVRRRRVSVSVSARSSRRRSRRASRSTSPCPASMTSSSWPT